MTLIHVKTMTKPTSYQKYNASLAKTLQIQKASEETRQAAQDASSTHKDNLLDAANLLDEFLENNEKKDKRKSQEDPIKILPPNATQDEISTARCRQAIKLDGETFLPNYSDRYSDNYFEIPNIFLRCALFSSSRNVQALNDSIISSDTSLLLANKPVACLSHFSITLNGYELCQFDRRVYMTCLNYYKNQPLSRNSDDPYIQTSFYEFTKKMGSAYSVNLHCSILASLLRLRSTGLKIRQENRDFNVPKLLSIKFQGEEANHLISCSRSNLKASDKFEIQVSEVIAELFGPGQWAAIEHSAINYNGLKGWVACFFASHMISHVLDIEKLHQITGYESRFSNFRRGFNAALDKLKTDDTPYSCKLDNYIYFHNGRKIKVTLTKWLPHKS